MGNPGLGRARCPGAPAAFAALALLVFGIAGCAKPPPDLDGQPGGAQTLVLGYPHSDQLHCEDGDCSDWYRLRIDERGGLTIRVAALQESVLPTEYGVQLKSGRNQLLAYADAVGMGRKQLRWKAEPGYYLIGISAAEKSPPLRYEVRASFQPEPPPAPLLLPPPLPPPPPEPRFEPLSAEVLEVEGRPGNPHAVLIDRGLADGLRSGLRGRLLENGEVIAIVEIVDAYPDGSRARIEGSLQAPITPRTRVEIDVPVNDESDGSAPRPD